MLYQLSYPGRTRSSKKIPSSRRTISKRLARRVSYRFRTSHPRLSCGVVASFVDQRCQRRCFPNIAATEIDSWWTGKDSNLRSPQGAADLQSAGFSHSPTRPHGGIEKKLKQRRPQCIREVCNAKRHVHAYFAMQEPASRKSIGILPLTRKILAELAEGFEPPTL